jgi:hypothetical protein
MDPSVAASVKADFYPSANSATVAPYNLPSSLSPRRSLIIDQRSGGGLDSQQNWSGGVVLSSDKQLAAIVEQYGGTTALGAGFRFDAYNGFTQSDADTTIIFPQLLKNAPDPIIGATYNSYVSIQNTGTATASNVTITYYSTPCSPATQSRTLPDIPPNSVYNLDMQSELSCVSGTAQGYWLGAAKLSSPSQPLVAVVNQNAGGILLSYRGFSPTKNAGARLLLPQILNAVLDQTGFVWGTSFLVMVADQSAANITATFYGDAGSFSITKSASPMALFDQRYDLQGRFFGSAIIQASGNKPIVAIENAQTSYINGRGVQIFTSRSFPDTSGTTTAFAPAILKTHLDSSGVTQSTSILIEFTGSTAPVTVTYYPSNGSAPFSTTAYPTSGSPLILVDQRYDGNVPNNFVGSAVLTSTQPFAANVNFNGGNSDPGDTAGVYGAVNQ